MNFVSQLSLSTRSSLRAPAADRPGKSIVSRFALAAILLVTMGFAQRSAAQATGAQANIALTNASAAFSQTSNTAWTLKKTGAVDSATSTITWTITATEGATVAGHLVVDGSVTVGNWGSLGAPIGNIVVNLQTKSGSSWVTESSDMADATHGDAATIARIDPKASSENKGTFSTNAASGKLEFMDANSNTAFSLKPEVTIAPGATVNLLFSAVFDNTVLKLAPGTAVRAEVIVSFGNSTSVPPSAHDVDINGNGQIDPDEVYVRSVPARLGGTVPPETAVNGSPTLTDAATDIAATGTATFSNPQFTLGVTTGTVTVNYDGGANGGTITNCAHLTSPGSTTTVGGTTFQDVGGLNLQACDTETIAANGVTAGWKEGDMLTYGADEYGVSLVGVPLGAQLLVSNYGTVYASTSGAFVIGDPSAYTATFDSGSALVAFLPQGGTVGVFTGNLFDPTTSSAGAFASDVAALKLDVDFSDAGVLKGNLTLKFGDLTLCNISSPTGLNGTAVRNFLGTANSVLGAVSTSFTATDLDSIALQLSVAFAGGNPSTWAQQHLFNGACPVWNNGDMLTYGSPEYGQDGDPPSPAEQLLVNNYATVYASTSGAFVIGDPSVYTATFDNGSALVAFLPQTETVGVFTGNLFDPTTSSAGAFASDVAALKVNVDYSDTGVLKGNFSLKFGDLMLCNISSPTGLNGTTVRSFLATANTELGSGTTSFTATALDSIAGQISAAFDSGAPSAWAQQHLRNGACH